MAIGSTRAPVAVSASGTSGLASLGVSFHLPGGLSPEQHSLDRPATPGALCTVQGDRNDAEAVELWIGLDSGIIAVFDVQSGVLVRSFACAGPEAVVSLAVFGPNAFVFALSAHRRVSVWDATKYDFLQKYPAELMTCGAELSAMVAVSVPHPLVDSEEPDMALVLLAGVDGSLCIRRVGRRHDGKMNCVLLCYLESVSANPGCPITSTNYDAETDSVLLGDAGCMVTVLSPLKDHLGCSGQEIPRLTLGSTQTASSGVSPSSIAPPAASPPVAANASSQARAEAPPEGYSGHMVNTSAAPMASAEVASTQLEESLPAGPRNPDARLDGNVEGDEAAADSRSDAEGAAPFPVFTG